MHFSIFSFLDWTSYHIILSRSYVNPRNISSSMWMVANYNGYHFVEGKMRVSTLTTWNILDWHRDITSISRGRDGFSLLCCEIFCPSHSSFMKDDWTTFKRSTSYLWQHWFGVPLVKDGNIFCGTSTARVYLSNVGV